MVRDFFIVYWYNLLYICHLLASYKKCIIGGMSAKMKCKK
mgnify:FL=1